MKFRRAISNLVACAIVAAVMDLGCGGAVQEERPAVVLRQPELPRMEERASIEVPVATVRAMTACVEAMNHQSAEPSHAFQYNLGTTAQGKVLEVNLRDSTLREPSLEACFHSALAAMDVPKDALRSRGSKPVSGGESTYSSRAELGIVQAAAIPIALAPIVMTALGVTIIVAISIDILRKAASEPDCKEVKEDCIVACNGKLPTGDFGFRFWNCVNRCMRTAGC